MFNDFTPVSATIGGAIIGLAASMLLLTNGRIAGISGIYKGLLTREVGDTAWKVAFIGGLVLAGGLLTLVSPDIISVSSTRSLWATGAAGLIVGVGVSMGNGCTSGHGVCGLSRFSRRSLIATLTFMATGFATATAIQWFLGGQI
ncbi:MAG: YeeE/YedE family protein [Myxococcota bacterium]